MHETDPNEDVSSDPPAGARTFQATGQSYDSFMGRYSRQLATPFADFADVSSGLTAVDVGCGPGALTGLLVERLGAVSVAAIDPSAPFVADCAARHPGADVRLGRAESLPFEDDQFDRSMAQLVLHFVSEPDMVAAEMRRVVRPGGVVAACVWDFAEGMQMLRHFWDAALDVDAGAPDEARTMRFGRPGEIAELFKGVGLDDVSEAELRVESVYESFDELWSGYLAGIGPAGSYCVALADDARSAVRESLFERVGSPTGSFTLGATARASRGTVPA